MLPSFRVVEITDDGALGSVSSSIVLTGKQDWGANGRPDYLLRKKPSSTAIGNALKKLGYSAVRPSHG